MPAAPRLRFLDPSLSIEERLADLVPRLTIEEQLRGGARKQFGSFTLPPPWFGWSETLHGLARHGVATVFPQAIALAATWDVRLMEQVADAISDEVRAKYHGLTRPGEGPFVGLLCGAPVVNIARDPRWGRTQETYGEDPVLTGRLAQAYIRGLQGRHPKYLKVLANVKHFAVHSGPEGVRHQFDAKVGMKDLHETYLPAFRMAVEAGAASIMASYNRINGTAACAHRYLLDEVLRQQWGFDGYVVPDYGAIHDMWLHHKIAKDHPEAVGMALAAGLDTPGAGKDVLEARARGLVSDADITAAYTNVARQSFRLGFFDPPTGNPHTRIPLSVVSCEKHRRLALTAAERSIVLLKNNGVLPLKPELRRILVTGPGAADIESLMGNYNGYAARMVTVLEGLLQRAGVERKVNYAKGCPADRPIVNSREITTDMVGGNELTIAVMGFDPLFEGEEYDPIMSDRVGDRHGVELPAHQIEFVKALRHKAPEKPIVLVLMGGSAIAIPELHELVDAVVHLWYPGQEGGTALARVLFGDVNPAGRLPLTVPRSSRDLPAFEDYAMRGRTYRFAKKTPLYPFGFGLSYTRFIYRGLAFAQRRLSADQSLRVSLTVKNAGKVAGDDVVQLYVAHHPARRGAPLCELKAFARVSLKPGQEREVRFVVTPEMLSTVAKDGSRSVLPGSYRITVGGASPGPRAQALGGARPVAGLVTVTAQARR